MERITDGNRITEGVTSVSPADMERIGRYMQVRPAMFRDWMPGGEGLLISTRFGNTSQLHVVREPLGAREQITFFDEPIQSASVSPSGNSQRVVFARDTGGDENWQLYHFDLETGEIDRITAEGTRNDAQLWSRDGRFLAWESNQRDPALFDVLVAAADALDEPRLLVEGTGFYWRPVDWSADGTSLLVQQAISVTNLPLWLVDVASGEKQRIGVAEEAATYRNGRFDATGEGIWLVSNEGTEFSELRHYRIEDSKTASVTSDIPWDVSGFELAPDASSLAFFTNEDGISRLYLLDTNSLEYRQVTALPPGVIYSIGYSPDGAGLAITIDRATKPANVYVYEPAGDTLVQWTSGETGGLRSDGFTEPELVHYETFDEDDGRPRSIPAFVFRPDGATEPGPVLIVIHGGPEGQSRPMFNPRVQFFANELGLNVIVPNVRGSTGYGKTYVSLDDQMLREDSVKDIGALIDWIATQPHFDSDRVLVSGGSYGGYMVLASLTHYSDRLTAGIDFFGVSDFATLLRNTADYRKDHRRQEYGDERDPEMAAFFERIAPKNNAHRITVPLLVAQGLNDPRVPPSESEQIVETVRKNGVDVWYVQFTDEGHGFQKRNNQVYIGAVEAAFLRNYVL